MEKTIDKKFEERYEELWKLYIKHDASLDQAKEIADMQMLFIESNIKYCKNKIRILESGSEKADAEWGYPVNIPSALKEWRTNLFVENRDKNEWVAFKERIYKLTDAEWEIEMEERKNPKTNIRDILKEKLEL